MLNAGVDGVAKHCLDLQRLGGGGHIPVVWIPAKQTVSDTAADGVCLKACLL